MIPPDTIYAAFAAIVQLALTVLVAPLMLGISKKVKARLQYRRGASLLQPYRDLAKWWRKSPVESDTATALTALAPALVFAALFVATLLVPLVAQHPPLVGWGDVLVVVGLMAAARFVLALSALDAGSAFGGMGSSREVAIATLVEPALLLALATAVVAAGSTDLGTVAGTAGSAGLAWYTPAVLLGAAAFAIVGVAETGHEPFDNPDTHLELTMIHEGMLLEASGRRLAMLVYAAQLKVVLVAGLFVAVFFPLGLSAEPTLFAVVVAAILALGKLLFVAVLLGLLDASLAKLRILSLPALLTSASLIACVGLATAIWLPR